MRLTKFLNVLIALVFLSTWNGLSFAADGDLDPNFGNDGKVTLDISGEDDNFYDVAVLSDGSIVVVGESWTGWNFDVVLAKYDSSGTLVNEFGSGGIVISDFGFGLNDGAIAIHALPNDQLLVAGYVDTPSSKDFLLMKYNVNGSLDTNFGTSGKVVQDISGDGDRAVMIGVQSTGRIVVGGLAGIGIGLAGFTSSGDLDSSFGVNGIMNLEVVEPYEIPTDMYILDDDRIMIAGYVDYLMNDPFLLVRYTANGLPDSNFGNGGTAKANLTPSDDHAESIAVRADGKIVLGGWVAEGPNDGTRDLALVQFNSDGSVDSDFGIFGVVILDLGGDLLPGNDRIHDMILQEDQKILVIGGSDVLANNDHFLLARFLSNGSVDGTFGSEGYVLTNFGPSFDSAQSAYLIDESMVVAGYTDTGDTDLAMARYLIGTSVPPPGDCTGALFCDLFDDDVLSPDWSYLKPSWNETGGSLTGTPSGKKAIAIAPTGWSASNVYSIQTTMKASDGEFSSVWLLGWYSDKKNTIELQMKEGNDKWILKHRVNGVVVAKSKGLKTILPNTVYSVKISFDGSQFQVFVDDANTPLITLQATHTVSAGTIGYQVKNTTGSFDSIRVD